MTSLAVVRDIHSPRSLSTTQDVQAYQEDLLAAYVLARSAHGVTDATVRAELSAVGEFLDWVDRPLWEVTAGDADRFLTKAQAGKAVKTRRIKAGRIAGFYRFLEVRYQGEIHELTGHVVVSPIDEINRPTNSGDFQERVPPAPGDLAGFFTSWRDALPRARKWHTAARNYTMARLTGQVGLRATECCRLGLDDVHFDHGPMGKIHVRYGKGSRGSGPRQRLVPMLGDARPLLQWWVCEVRGEFADDFNSPRAPLFPSERGGPTNADAFRISLKQAASEHLGGPVRQLTPHVLRHACASGLYRDGVGLMAIQQLLGHHWLTTTMRYVHVSNELIEAEYVQASDRAAARFTSIRGG
ncbi:tyrosine-type recombinase/integrase [Leekyejoonella antrihumi]|uniref:Site-specific integrase n=1 Tax=Leekyejoonella antrihumi TaxID=1660198 RepID=A0A563DQ46_9MICO|nr:tyrosine-type recombinase/integrase [Leekyejoonella antrihumi]TWP32073.1 site-specific integrase [Leekyejoonella antrihumi]